VKFADIPRTTLMHWERTGQLIARKHIIKLASLYAVPVEEFLRMDRFPRKRNDRAGDSSARATNLNVPAHDAAAGAACLLPPAVMHTAAVMKETKQISVRHLP
jgi:hypothetical protein